MSKIPTLPSAGSQRLINVPGSSPNGGVNLAAQASMPGWPPHNPAQANGQRAGVPDATAPAPKQGLPGKALDFPATAVPGTARAEWSQDAFGVAGRSAAYDRESAPASAEGVGSAKTEGVGR